ncbi:MAG: DUF3050 domain-containing protein [Chitinophagales bacterium]|nr:DUF3050 domain-containing protein [Chitinophagales bacterium]
MYLDQLRSNIDPLRQQIIQHPLYGSIHSVDALRIYMEHHVYAVWDFMSLLKSLQRKLTCVSLPWLPVGSANTRFLINEIVAGEESDVDAEGNRISHFELYLQAMEKAGADTRSIRSFVTALQQGKSVADALQVAEAPAAAKQFVLNTFQLIDEDQSHVLSAVFTFGREDLIPEMFLSLINKLETSLEADISIFKYYIERHIEVDGGHHSQLALEMTSELCGHDSEKWMQAGAAVEQALRSRVLLWSGALQEIQLAQPSLAD